VSTRAYICELLPNDMVRYVYNHFDGYPSGLGKKLLKFFKNSDSVKRLIDGGDISYIKYADNNNDYSVEYFKDSPSRDGVSCDPATTAVNAFFIA